jgi:hypothetical protein
MSKAKVNSSKLVEISFLILFATFVPFLLIVHPITMLLVKIALTLFAVSFFFWFWEQSKLL